MILNSPLSWLEINRTALEHNALQFKKMINHRILAPVIKSNGYGHGMLEVAQIFNNCSAIDWLCVALLSEALQLRAAGITKPILVLSVIDADPLLAAQCDINIIIYDLNHAQALNSYLSSHKISLSVHIKIDTGLSRYGIPAQSAIKEILHIAQLPSLKINGIFSHLAESQKQDNAFTLQQISLFTAIITHPDIVILNIPYKHIANSAAAILYDLPECNFFRIGLGMYGAWPSDYVQNIAQKKFENISLQQALSWKSRITHIKTIPANSFVGYNREFCTTRETKIAMLPIGYFDGYDLRLSNKSLVMLHHIAAPIIGRICMNVIIIDITDIPNAKIGDEVLLLGNIPGVRINDLTERSCQDNRREIISTLHSGLSRIITETTQSINIFNMDNFSDQKDTPY
jgi:alanine racemase